MTGRTGPGSRAARWAAATSAGTARLLIVLVRGYQVCISPILPPSCRFHPSCSAYAIEALREHGPVRGLALSAWRLLRCAPWHRGGLDPVPPRRTPGPRAPSGAEGHRADAGAREHRADAGAREHRADAGAGRHSAPEERVPC